MEKHRLPLFMAAGLIFAFGVTACSGTNTPNLAEGPTNSYDCTAPNADTVTDIRIVGLPILSNGALFAGVEQGIFEKHGLNPEIEMVASVPATISAVVGGSAEFGFTATINALQAIEQGQQIQVVSAYAGVEPGFYDKMTAGESGYESGINALLVQDGGGIEDVRDLAGKTIAVNDPGYSSLITHRFIEDMGGDPEASEYVVLPPADAYNAVLAKQVDAAVSLEPFIMGYEEAGLKTLGWLEAEVFRNGAQMSVMIAAEKYIEANPEIATRFNCAIEESTEFANAEHDEIRAATARAQGVDLSAFDDQLVPWFFTSPDLAGFEMIQNEMVDFGLLEEVLPLDRVLAPAAIASAEAG